VLGVVTAFISTYDIVQCSIVLEVVMKATIKKGIIASLLLGAISGFYYYLTPAAGACYR